MPRTKGARGLAGMERAEFEWFAKFFARRAGMSVSEAKGFCGDIGEIIMQALTDGDEVGLEGFGRWRTRQGYRRTWNPQKGRKGPRGKKRVCFRMSRGW